MDQKVSAESFKAYRDWQRYIRKAHPKLGKGLVKSTLVSYCLSMASDGANGIGCYTSDATIADDLELYDYRSVARYRREALRLGWFAWTGKKRGRSQVLDIAIPADDETSVRTDVPADNETPRVSADGHVTASGVVGCPACLEHMRKIEYGEADPSVPVWEIHTQALGRLGV